MAITAEPETAAPAIPLWHLGDRLGKALDHAGLKHQDMAAILEVGRNTIGNYVNGRSTPTIATLRVWAIETGVSLEWLRGHDEFCGECGNIRSRCLCASALVSGSQEWSGNHALDAAIAY